MTMTDLSQLTEAFGRLATATQAALAAVQARLAPARPPIPDGLASGAITLQQAVTAAHVGASIGVPGRVFNEAVTIWTPGLTLVGYPGAVIDGQHARTGLQIRASDVTALDIAVRNTLNGSMYEGSVDVRGPVSRCVLRVVVSGGSAMGVYIEGGSGHDVSGEVSAQAQTGIHLHNLTSSRLHDALLHGNSVVGASGENGGAKFVLTDGVIATDVQTWGNNGPGLWWDGFLNASAQRVRGHDNKAAGLMFEAGRNAVAYGNTLWRNWAGYNPANDIDYTGQVRVDSCADVAVQGNLLAYGVSGVTLKAQNRADATGANMGVTRKSETGIVVNGNVISGMSLAPVRVTVDAGYADQSILASVVTPNEVVATSDARVAALP